MDGLKIRVVSSEQEHINSLCENRIQLFNSRVCPIPDCYS